jgi:hypothetical protein
MKSASKVQELRSIEAQLAELTARQAELQPEVAGQIEFFEKVKKTCDDRGISRRELALDLCPELAKGMPSSEVKTRKARSVKQYKNPNTGELIETKGGNHKGLKEWKTQYGNDVVESWASVVQA